jgi:hypothetical protein
MESAAVPARALTNLQSFRSPIVVISIAVAVACVIALVIAMRGGDLPARTMPDDAQPSVAVTVPVDAAEEVTSLAVDAADVGVPPIVASEPASDAGLDAGVEVVDAGVAVVDQPPVKGSATRPPRKPQKDRASKVQEMFTTHNFQAVLDECLASAAIPPIPCVLSACQLGNRKLAVRWWARVPANQHAGTIKACGSVLDHESKPDPEPDCEKHPLDCIR